MNCFSSKIKRTACFMLATCILTTASLCTVCNASYSGSTAKTVYKAAKVDTLSAKAYIVVDTDSGKTLMQSENADKHFTVGNLVKLMTVYVVMKKIADKTISYDTVIQVTKTAQKMSEGRSRVFLDAGKKEKITVREALSAVMTAGAYDAAYSLAECVGLTEKRFADMMNQTAKEIGMTDTVFMDATGILTAEYGQYSTAKDMAELGRHLITEFPEIKDFAKVTFAYFEHTSTGCEHTQMISSNDLIRHGFFPQCTGLMTGYSKADGYCQVMTAEDEEHSTVAVVMGEPDESYRAAELRFLTEYSWENFEYKLVDPKGTFVRKVEIKDGKSLKIKTETAEDFYAIVNVGDEADIKKEILLDVKLTAPVKKGVHAGYAIYKSGDEELGRVELITSEDMTRASWFTRFIRKILSIFGLN